MSYLQSIVCPLNNGGDDSANLQTILANSVGSPVMMSPGTYAWKSPCLIPSGSILIGSPGVKIVSTMTNSGSAGGYAQSCFYNFLVATGTATTLSSAIVIGQNTLSIVANNVNVGDTVLFEPSGINNITQVCKVLAKSGSSTPWILTLDAPVEYAMSAGSTVQTITRGHDIKIQGNGMTITGTGDRAIELGAVENCVVSGINVTREDGYFVSICCSYDIAGRNNVWRDMKIDAGGGQCGLALECNVGSRIEDCYVSYATLPTNSACGFYLPTSKRCSILNSIAQFCYIGCYLGSSASNDAESCQRCLIQGCQFIDNSSYGLDIQGGIDNYISNNIIERNIGAVAVTSNSVTQADRIFFNNCSASNSSGSQGFTISGINIFINNCSIQNNAAFGLQCSSDTLGAPTVFVNNCVANLNTSGAFNQHSANGRLYVNNIRTCKNSGLVFSQDGAGILSVNGWYSEDDGYSGSGVWSNNSTGKLCIEMAYVKNLTCPNYWTGVMTGTGSVLLTDYTSEWVSGAGIKAIVDANASGTLICRNVKSIGAMTSGIYAGHGSSVTCKISVDDRCDFTSAGTQYLPGTNPDGYSITNSGLLLVANGTASVTQPAFCTPQNTVILTRKADNAGTPGPTPRVTMGINTFSINATAGDLSTYYWKII